MARKDRTARVPPEVTADVVDLLAACPAFAGLPRETLVPLARESEIDVLSGSGPPVTTALVVMRGGVLVRDAGEHTVDLLGEGEYVALADGETVAAVETGLVVWLPGTARDLAWSAPVDRLRAASSAGASAGASPDLQLAAVRTIMRSPVRLAEAGETCRDVARRMSDERISSVLLRIGDDLGIATDRDLRTRLVAEGRSADTPIGDIATVPARTIDAATPVFEALVEMLATGIHHLPVTESGRLVGMVSSGDLNQLGSRSPLQVRMAIDRAGDIDAVAAALRAMPEMVGALLAAGTAATDAGRVIATVTDRVQRRVMELVQRRTGPPPTAYAWVAYGSQARREQTLLSDQDHGLILAEPPTGDPAGDPAGGPSTPEVWWADYTAQVVDALERCGYPRCHGEVMTTNPAWRHGVEAWRRIYAALIERPSPRHLMESAIAFDLRTIAGDLPARDLMTPTLATAARSDVFLGQLARIAVGHRPPLGFLGRITVERSGDHAGAFDVKAAAMLPIADLARVVTLARGGTEVATDDRLAAAAADGQLSDDLASTLRGGYQLALRLRLEHHLRRRRAGEPLDNWLEPSTVNAVDRSQLRETFKAVRVAQEALTQRYRTGMLG